MALLRQVSNGLLAGLEGDVVWAHCNSRLRRGFLFMALKHSVVQSKKYWISKLLQHKDTSRVLCSNNWQKHVAHRYKRQPIIHTALLQSDPGVVDMIARRMKEAMATVQNADGDTCLHLAARTRDGDLGKLLSHFSDRISLNILNDNGNTPLMVAIHYRRTENIQAVLDFDSMCACNINIQAHGMPIHVAAWCGGVDIFRPVYDGTFEEFRMSRCMHGYTAFMIACLREDIDIIHFILERTRDEVSVQTLVCAQNSLGQTCLHFAILNGNAPLVRLILSVCPLELLSVKNVCGSDALALAHTLGAEEIIKALREFKTNKAAYSCPDKI
tara:strand:- start:3696 stop:4679 length:984 start_codon:yes stop_codon:yes gene_type:complete